VVKSIPYAVIALYASFISLGFFESAAYGKIIKLLLLFPLACLFIFYLSRNLKEKKLSLKKRITFGLVAILFVKALFLFLAGTGVEPFPVDIFILIVLALTHPFLAAVTYTALVLLLNGLHAFFLSYFANESLSMAEGIYRALFIVAIVAVVETFLTLERQEKKEATERLDELGTLATSILIESGRKDDSQLAISEEIKDKLFLDSAYHLSNAISDTLGILHEMLDAFSCCLFIVGKDCFKLVAAVSDSKGFSRTVPREKGKNLLSWIDENEQPLITDRLSEKVSTGYYKGIEAATAFIGIPVLLDNNSGKAILCVDRTGSAFNREDKKLLQLAGSTIRESLKKSATMEKMRLEALEFQAFYKLTKELNSTLDPQQILDMALKFSNDVVHYDLSAIALKNNSGEIHFVKAMGEGANELLKKGNDHNLSIFQWVVKKEQPYHYSRDVIVKKVFPDLPPPIARMGSFLALPLIVGNVVSGVYLTARKDRKSYTPYDVKLIEAMTTHVSMAKSNATIYKKMEEMAITDGLTGLNNHRYFQERLSEELERSDRYKDKFALFLTDIDFFKKVNDVYGHPAGDKILKGVSQILTSSIRNVDFAARYGGEEFAAILLNADKKMAIEIAGRLRKTIEETDFPIGDGKSLKITMSIGIATYPGDADTKSLLISKADETLYLAKKEGRNRAYVYSDVKERLGEEY